MVKTGVLLMKVLFSFEKSKYIVVVYFADNPTERHRSMHDIDANNLMKIYDTVPRNDEMFALQRSQIKLDQENLGL